jgi:hypothetical protein
MRTDRSMDVARTSTAKSWEPSPARSYTTGTETACIVDGTISAPERIDRTWQIEGRDRDHPADTKEYRALVPDGRPRFRLTGTIKISGA